MGGNASKAKKRQAQLGGPLSDDVLPPRAPVLSDDVLPPAQPPSAPPPPSQAPAAPVLSPASGASFAPAVRIGQSDDVAPPPPPPPPPPVEPVRPLPLPLWSQRDFPTQLEGLRANDPTLTSLEIGRELPAGLLTSKDHDGRKKKKKQQLLLAELNKSGQVHHELSSEEYAQLCEALGANTNLLSLRLVRQKSAVHSEPSLLARMLQVNVTLTSLDLVDVGVDDSVAMVLSGGLAAHPSLRSFRLGHEKALGPAGVQALCASLMNACPELQCVELSGINRFGVGGVPGAVGTLCELVRSASEQMEEINLAHSCLKASGVEQLCAALVECKKLRILNLSGNSIGDAGAKAVASLLRTEKSSLESVSLIGCSIGEAGGQALLEALQSSPSSRLARMELQDDGFFPLPIMEAIQKLVVRNHGPAAAAASMQASRADAAMEYVGDESSESEVGDA